MGVVHASPGPAGAGLAAPAQRGRHRVPAWPRRARPASAIAVDGWLAARLRPRSATTSSAVVPGFERLQRARSRGRGGFALPNPPRDSAHVPDADGQGPAHRQPARALVVPAGPAAAADHPLATTSTTPRSTASTTATAASPAGAGSCSCNADDLGRARPRRRRRRRPRQRVADGVPTGGRRRFRVVAYPIARGCARPTSPRPTCSCRSTARPSRATRRRRSRSSSASSRAPVI